MNLANTGIGKRLLNKVIGKRFYFIFAIVIGISAVGVSYLMYNMLSQKSEVDSIYKVRLLSIENLIEADRDAYQSSIAISQLINKYYEGYADRASVKKHIGSINENLGQIRERFDKFARLYLKSGGERVGEFSIFDAQYAEMVNHTGRIVKFLDVGAYKPASTVYNSEYESSFSKVRNAMDVLTGISLDLTEKEYNAFNVKFIMSMIFSVIIASAIIIVLTMSGIFLTQTITTPINLSMAFADKLAHGDFSDRIDLHQKDEFGDLANSLNKAANDLEKLISDIKISAVNLSAALDDISSGNQDLSTRTTEQASSIQEIAATLEETTASSTMTFENSEKANQLADKTKQMADKGNKIVMEAVNSIYEINESSKQIEEIIILIDKISSQTNLLALNASIEAARAGVHGRGFAVVAGEVRELARKSTEAANKIAELIKHSTQKIEKGTDLVKQSGESLREIVASMEELAEIISSLRIANSEQKEGMNQINTAILEIDSVTQQNSALVEETASASEEISAQAKELKEMMGRFTIRDDRKV